MTGKIIGFTGTQQGMTKAQKARLRQLLEIELELAAGYCGGVFEFHHGDCIGGDSEAHDIATQLDAFVVIHPPVDPKKRANKMGYVLPSKPYIQRNHDIVDACDVLFAAPASFRDKVRSGTWATIRYARAQHKLVVIIFPSGAIEHAENSFTVNTGRVDTQEVR